METKGINMINNNLQQDIQSQNDEDKNHLPEATEDDEDSLNEILRRI